MVLRALVLDCSPAATCAARASEDLTHGVLAALSDLGVEGCSIRVLDHDVRLGEVTEGGWADAWPSICEQVMAADIVVVGMSWSEQAGSECRAVLDRLGTAPGEKVAVGVVVGSGAGGSQVGDALTQRLARAGFTIPEGGVRCWDERELGWAGGSGDAAARATTQELAASAAGLAARLTGPRRSLV